MLPILATILAQAANIANKNLSELKSKGHNETTANAINIASLIADNSGIASNGGV